MYIKTGRFLAFCFFLVFTGTQPIFPLDIDGRAPSFSRTGEFAGIVNILNGLLQYHFNSALNQARGVVDGINPKPERFIRAWSNSAAFASHGATQQAYGEYNLLSLTAGAMIGLQIPSSPFTFADEFDNIPDTMNRDGDLQIGFNLQAFVVQLGINTSRFLLNNLYLGFRFGYVNIRENSALIPIDGFSYNTTTLGILANYQLFSEINLGRGLFQWRRLNLGTGFVYNRTGVRYRIALAPFSANFYVPGLSNVGLRVDPGLDFDMNINTFTIPLEAVTSVRLSRFFNFALGLGADLVFGRSDIRIGMEGDINVTGIDNFPIRQEHPGYLSIATGGAVAPNFFNPKLMFGLGFTTGPFILDIPVTWYFGNHGFNVGITAGFSW